MSSRVSLATRLPLTLLVAATLAAGVSACGGSDDDGDSAAGPAPQAQQPDESDESADGKQPLRSRKRQESAGDAVGGPALSGDTEEARAGAVAVDGAYKDLAEAVESGVAAIDVEVGNTLSAAEGNEGLAGMCELMSEEAKRQTITYASRSAGLADVDWTCEKATALLLRRTRESRALESTVAAEVIGVNAEGDRATASVRLGGRKSRVSSIPLVKEDGKWKLAASPGEDR